MKFNRATRKNVRFVYSPLEPRQLLASGADLVGPDLVADYYVEDQQQELLAREYLATNNDTSSIEAGPSRLELVEIKRGIATTVTRFQQTIHGDPVVDAYVATVQGPTGEFLTVHDQSFHGELDASYVLALNDFEGVEQLAKDHAGVRSTFATSRGQLSWLVNGATAEQVWEMTVFGVNEETHGDFLTFIDANSDKLISQENRISNFESGSGEVFYPNPYQTIGSGTGITDGDDADSAVLTNERINVTLEGLDEGTGLLIGEFVDLATLNSTDITDVDANEPSRVYDYTRDDPRFEQVQIYHTVDQINRHFHALGFDDDTGTPNGIRDFPTLANAHWFEDDQSFYSSGNDAIHFGDGGVDDGEDGDIIAHEYGHAIQNNQNAAWGGGEMGAMGEGFGDYLAASFFQDVGDAAFQAAHAAAVGEWDATSYSGDDPPNLRRVDGNKMYPGDLTGAVHGDGEIWSRALWDINQALGADYADQIVLESHFTLPANSTMVTAAEMVLLANENINGGANYEVVRQAFEDRGILDPPPTIGSVSLDKSIYEVGDIVSIQVIDANAPAAISVTIVSSNGDMETIALNGDGVFDETIATEEATPTANDGVLQAELGDTFTVTYEDLDDGAGDPVTATDSAIFATTTTFTSDDTPVNIVDNDSIQSTISIVDSGTLIDVDLQLNITHTWVGDLTGTLTAPGGEVFTLFAEIGFSGDNYEDTRFDDEADVDIGSGSAPFTGSFRPVDSFSTLDGSSITGDWVLTIADSATLDTGTLNSWSLFIAIEPSEEIGPVSDANTDADAVPENSPAGTPVGITATATDDGDTVTYSLSDDAGGLFAVDPNSGVVTVAGDLDYESAQSYSIDVRATSSDTSASQKSFTISVLNVDDGVVSARNLFYRDSSFDVGTNASSIDPNKEFLTTGVTATFDNYSTYSLGLNGIAVEVGDLNNEPTLANVGDFFEFTIGNDDTPGDWAVAAAPTELIFEPGVGAGGADVVYLSWANNAIQNTWLEITVLAGAVSGLPTDDVFYFGNVIGDTGNEPSNAVVNLQDVSLTRENQSGFGFVGIESAFDFDRSGRVTLVDVALARENQSGFAQVNLITPGSAKNKGVGGDSKKSLVLDPPSSDFKMIPQFQLGEDSGVQAIEGSEQEKLTLLGGSDSDGLGGSVLQSDAGIEFDSIVGGQGDDSESRGLLDDVFGEFDLLAL